MRIAYTFLPLLLLIVVTAPVAVFAQPIDEDVIVITASRVPKALKDVPVRTHVIDAQAVEQAHARNMQDVLKYVPGINIKDIHGKTGQSAWIQGFDADRVLVLVDGERVSASTGTTIDLSQLGATDIKQVEVVKGAASALYGSSAMGGVINIITKTPETGWHGSLRADAGTFAEKNRRSDVSLPRSYVNGQASYADAAWEMKLAADYRDSDGYLLSRDGYSLRGEDGTKSNAVVSLTRHLNDALSTGLSYRTYREDYRVHDAIAVPAQPAQDRTESVQSEHVSGDVHWQLNAVHEFTLKAYQEDYTGDINAHLDSRHRHAQIQLRAMDVQHDWTSETDWVLSSGVVLNSESLQQSINLQSELDGSFRDKKSHELFMQLDYFVNAQWEVLPGFRYEHDTIFGSHWSPKISIMRTNQTQSGEGRLRMSLGNGYRVPSIKERYFVFDHSHLGYMVMGNPRLQPESANSAQLGYQFWSNTSWQVDTNLFYNDINDLIAVQQTHNDSRGVAINEYTNIEHARTYGVELSASMPLMRALDVTASYVYTRAINERINQPLPKRPEHVAKVAIDIPMFRQRAGLSLNVIAQSKEYVYETDAQGEFTGLKASPKYMMLDIKYNHTLHPHVDVFWGVDNVFDTHRDPVKAADNSDFRPVPGRMAYAGFKTHF